MKIFTWILAVMVSTSIHLNSSSQTSFGFQDPEYSFQSLRAIAAATVGAADIGECLVTIAEIKEGNDESWYTQWYQIAQRLRQEAMDSKAKGHIKSARSAFRRASNYYRCAEFFLHTHPKDPRIVETWNKSRECFREAVKDLSSPVTVVRIPFEGTTLPGYLCLVDKSETPRPLIIMQTGFDGTAEEIYFAVGQAAVKRGYHVLIFEGPGQGEMIRIQDIPFRHNWETVISPVVDFAFQQKQVDKERIALMGISMGGYLVPRALAFEHRPKIGIANGGVYDFHAVCMQSTSADLEKQLDDPDAAKEIDLYIEEAAQANPTIRWAFGNGMYTFHAKTPSEWLRMTRPYHLRDVVQNIRCKMLIIDSDHDFQMKNQAQGLFQALSSPKEFMLFKATEGAGAHCQVGAYTLAHERMFNWLDSNL